MIVVFGKSSNWKKSNKLTLKNRTYYFCNDKTDLKKFETNLLKIDTKSYKNNDIYYIGYIKIKKVDEYAKKKWK